MPIVPSSTRGRTRPAPVAAIATLGLGFLAGVGNPALAIVGATLVTLILALKAEMHGLIGKLDDEDVKALARYAVIAGAILPFLPNGNYGPLWCMEPAKAAPHRRSRHRLRLPRICRQSNLGQRQGTIATAIIGGLYSSTAVTQSLAQRLGTIDKGAAGRQPVSL